MASPTTTSEPKLFDYADGRARSGLMGSDGKFMPKDDYKARSDGLARLSAADQKILTQIERSVDDKTIRNPLESMKPDERVEFDKRMATAHVDPLDRSTRWVLDDMKGSYEGAPKRSSGPAYNDRILEVGGRPVSESWMKKNPEQAQAVVANWADPNAYTNDLKHQAGKPARDAAHEKQLAAARQAETAAREAQGLHVKVPHGNRLFGALGTAAVAAVVGGVTLAGGGTKAQAAEATVSALPVGGEVVAASQGRFAEAAIQGVEEIPVVGAIAGAVARPLAQMAGADVDTSIVQDGLQAGRENRARQADLHAQVGNMNDMFHTLRDNGFGGSNKAEMDISRGMRQVAEQFIGGVGRPDAVAKTQATMQQTASKLADYLESPNQTPDIMRTRELVRSTLGETPEQFIKQLRETASDLKDSAATSAPDTKASQPAPARTSPSTPRMTTALAMS